MKRRPCWCPKSVLWELNSVLMQTLSFVPVNLHKCWPRKWKRSIRFLTIRIRVFKFRLTSVSFLDILVKGCMSRHFPAWCCYQKHYVVALQEIGYKSYSLTEHVTRSQWTQKAFSGRWKIAGAFYKPIGSFWRWQNRRLSFQVTMIPMWFIT